MSTYHPPAHRFRGIFCGPTTELGRWALRSLAVSFALLVAMIVGEGVGGVARLAGLLGAVGSFLTATVTAAAAVISRAERSPAVVAVALVTSFVVLDGSIQVLQSLIR